MSSKVSAIHPSRLLIFLSIAMAITVIAFVGCDKKPVTTTTETWRSPHFDAVNEHLDLGGTVYAYIDIDKDAKKLAEDGNRLLKMLSESSDGEIPADLGEKLDFTTLIKDLGIDNLVAVGASSRRDGDRYMNRAVLYTPEGRRGLFKLLGGSAQPFKSLTMAPEDADLVLERDLNLAAVMEMAQRITSRFPEANESLKQAMAQNVMSLSMNVGDFLGKFDTKIIIIGRIDPVKKMQLPMAPVEVPELDLMIALENLPWLWQQIKEQMPPQGQSPVEFSSGQGFEAYGMPDMTGNGRLQPQLYFDKASGMILIGTSADFIKSCLKPSTSITANSDFKDATSGLPTEGNGFSYASADIVEELTAIILAAAEMSSGMGATAPGPQEIEIMKEVVGFYLPEQPAGVASVSANLDEGVVITSKTYDSHKSTMLSAANPTVIAMLASMSFPAYQKIGMRAKSTQQINNVRQLILGLRTCAADENGKFPDRLDALIEDGYIDMEELFYDDRSGFPEELLYNAGLHATDRANLILVASPEPVDGKRVVGYIGGMVKELDEAEYQLEQEVTEAFIADRKTER
jgi:hypothetical protein